MIGIIGAMDEEIALYKSKIKVEKTEIHAGIEYIKGQFKKTPVVLLCSGIGKVHAAAATQILIDKYKVESIVFTGLAGSLVPYLKGGDIVVANYLVQHDMNLTAFGRRHGEIPSMGRMIEANPEMIEKVTKSFDRTHEKHKSIPQLIVGTIASGDEFISDKKKVQWLQREFGAVATEMEGAAVAQVSTMNKIPFLILRTISDSASDSATEEFAISLKTAHINAYHILEDFIQQKD